MMQASLPDVSNRMRSFFVIWAAQIVSLVGSQLTGFALGVWVYDETRSVLMLSLTQIALHAPMVIASPLAGVLVDRWERRTAMIVSDIGAGLAVLAAAILYLNGQLEPWMVIAVNFAIGTFHSLMWPAYSASVTLLVPKEHYGRANGLVQLGEAVPQIAGPAIAGALYAAIHLGYLALIDVVTYVVASSLLFLLVRIPAPPVSAGESPAGNSIRSDMAYGWHYITNRRSLFALLLFFLGINFLASMLGPLFVPLVLENWDERVLGVLSTTMGVGMLTGTLAMSAWGGGKRRVITLLAGTATAFLFMAVMGVRASIPLIAIGGFGYMFAIPIVNGTSQSIWQSKVAPDIQGRVFSIRRAIGGSMAIFGPLLAAPLADQVFKPAMAAGGALQPYLGPLLGVGESRGIGLMVVLLGLLASAASIGAFGIRSIRNLESDLPDHAPALTPRPV